MAVEMALVTVGSHIDTTSISATIESFMERHDIDGLILVNVVLLRQFHHTIFHCEIIMILLELNSIIATPRMNMVRIILTPNVFRSLSYRWLILSVRGEAAS